jgi:hypothetical protein
MKPASNAPPQPVVKIAFDDAPGDPGVEPVDFARALGRGGESDRKRSH